MKTPSRRRGVHDGGHAEVLARHLGDDVLEERVLPDNRDRVPGVHQIGDPEERAPAEGAPGVERRVVLRAEPAELEQDHGEGVTGGERRGGARRRGQVHRARLLEDAHVEHHLALAREPGDGAAGQEDDRDTEPLEGRQDREDLIRLARVREGQHDVAAGHHPEVAVDALGGMQEVGGRARRGERRGDLAADVPRLPHAGHDHAAGAAVQELDRPVEARVELRDEAEDRLGFEAQHALREPPEVAPAHVRRAASMAPSSWRSRGRSSMRSMFGPSESGRPSGSVRSGSSCISMKRASTPKATAARASGGT